MDATPNFGVTMISEVPSNPYLTEESEKLMGPIRRNGAMFDMYSFYKMCR